MSLTVLIIALIVLIVLWAISLQRRMVRLEELCRNAMSQIGVQQNSRWDALKALAELTKSYSEHEYKALTDIIAQRKNIGPTSTPEQVKEQEKIMSNAMAVVNAVSEQYPDLKANTMYIKTMDSVNEYENQVRMSRMVYNDAVTRYNQPLRQLPNSLIVPLFGFKEKEYLETPAEKTDMPSMKI